MIIHRKVNLKELGRYLSEKYFLKRSMLRPKLQIILLNTWDFLVINHYGEIDKTLLFFGPEGCAVCQGKEKKKKKRTLFSLYKSGQVRF